MGTKNEVTGAWQPRDSAAAADASAELNPGDGPENTDEFTGYFKGTDSAGSGEGSSAEGEGISQQGTMSLLWTTKCGVSICMRCVKGTKAWYFCQRKEPRE